MPYFLRFTAAADLDLARGTSYHETPWDEDERTIEEVADACDCSVDAIEVFDFRGRGVNTYMQALGGLCGFELEAETLEAAIEEVVASWSGTSAVGFSIAHTPWAIFQGSVEDQAPDGVVFYPSKLVYTAQAAA